MSKKTPVMSHDPLAELAAANAPAEIPQAERGDGQDVAAVGEAAAALRLPSSLTIADVGELQPALLAQLQRADKLEVDASEVEIVDGAGLQLLAALSKAAADKSLSLSWLNPSGQLRQAADQIGLAGLLKMN